MNIFDIYGYRSERPYSIESKTNVGQYALIAATGPQSYTLSGAAGSYGITGNNATFVFPQSYTLLGDAGSYSIVGNNVTFSGTVSRILSCEYGTYVITGNDAGLSYNTPALTTVETLIKLRSFTERRRF